jgi:hypothetical protein
LLFNARLMSENSVHTFHIPVMGLAYTMDTPVKVARFGISSVISIIQDALVEKMREHYYGVLHEKYIPIPHGSFDYRARRVTDYLNLVNRIVLSQVEEMKKLEFIPGSELSRFFEMLPDTSPLKAIYLEMLQTGNRDLETILRDAVRPGRIDVNIMTKLDRNTYDEKGNVIPDTSDAVSALRGYANSDLKNSTIIFSAGMNPRLYAYLGRFSQFTNMKNGVFEKMVGIKVSDFRSAYIQGKYLTNKGIWVSEFRIESGLNCGGHLFPTDGQLLGPILEEFKSRYHELKAELFQNYCNAKKEKGSAVPVEMPPMQFSVQGGIGTSEEDRLLHDYYGMDSTGWGTPFLLVPEATTVDKETLGLLARSRPEDITVSDSSPLGIKFSYLKGTSAEKERLERISCNNPGSPCTEHYLSSDVEFTEKPICTSSMNYQRNKLEQLSRQKLSAEDYSRQREKIIAKECLCIGLSNTGIINNNLTPIHGNSIAVTCCPGPNIAYFNKISSLKDMIDHIYGRKNLLGDGYRPHFFLNELSIYINYLKEKASECLHFPDLKGLNYFNGFGENLLNGINYYRRLADNVLQTSASLKIKMKNELQAAEEQILMIVSQLREFQGKLALATVKG